MGFEYGYSTTDPNCLVIWEAQFGDFANGAQVVIDQFISSGESKWGRICGLTLFLPHGYEGQGPEHSSARLERFLQLCAENNMQVCVPSTPAQMFHMLRRQMLRSFRKPLIVMTPKSLLRHKLSVSALDGSRAGPFPERDRRDRRPAGGAGAPRRVLLGQVYFDLLEARRADEARDVALVRIEQLYPFPTEEYAAILRRYPNAAKSSGARRSRRTRAPGTRSAIVCRSRSARGRSCCTRGARRPPHRPRASRRLHTAQQHALVGRCAQVHHQGRLRP